MRLCGDLNVNISKDQMNSCKTRRLSDFEGEMTSESSYLAADAPSIGVRLPSDREISDAG